MVPCIGETITPSALPDEPVDLSFGGRLRVCPDVICSGAQYETLKRRPLTSTVISRFVSSSSSGVAGADSGADPVSRTVSSIHLVWCRPSTKSS